MTTISVSSTIGISLTSPSYTSPVVIEAGVTVSNSAGNDAVYGSSAWTIQNVGSIAGNVTSKSGVGIFLIGGGSVANQSGGTISGFNGIETRNVTSTIENAGGIVGNGGPNALNGANGVGTGAYLDGGGLLTNLSAAVISGYDGIFGGSGHYATTVVNAGTIAAETTYGDGVRLRGGGSVTNQGGGTISGGRGIYGFLRNVIVVNAGSIEGKATNSIGVGVYLKAGGSVINQSGGTIGGYAGITGGGTLIVTNAGNVAGLGANGMGVHLQSVGSVTNAVSGSIAGYVGVDLSAGGTLTNAGTIVGNAGTAVSFGGTGSDLLVLDPGFEFSGLVTGSTTASDTLELASAASAGMLSGLGSEYINFTQSTIDIGATWTLTGTNTVSAGQTMTNFGSLKLLGAALTIDGDLINDGTISTDPSSLTATSIGGSGTINIGANSTITTSGSVSAGQTIAFTGSNGVLNILHSGQFAGTITGQGPTDVVTMACFAASTRITTDDGYVSVEDLCIGQLVPTVRGRLSPIIWIGHREVDCKQHPKPVDIWPVRVHANAFASGMPHRDLLLSPDHAVFTNGVLIPIRYLINGRTIVQEPVEQVTYYHVELAQHDVILAEGLPCESYLDTGNRGAFANGSNQVTQWTKAGGREEYRIGVGGAI